MKRSSILNKIMLLETVIAVAWAAILLGFTDFKEVGFYFWGGFACTILAYVLCIGSLFLLQMRENRNLTEINVIPVWASLAYLGVTVLVNSVFVAMKDGDSPKPLVIINVILLIAFLALRMFTDNYADRVDRQTNRVVEKIQPVAQVSARVAAIISMANNQEVKKRLIKLKEIIDYSSNVSQVAGEQKEAQILVQLGYLENLIRSNAEEQVIFDKIEEATATWRSRNGANSMLQ